ncbi:MAG: hybrid sensor histidine kinase/response regulator, partial [Nitrospiraceae bacterium]
AALDALGQQTPDLVCVDIQMPKLSGIEVLKRIKSQWPDLPVIIMTAHGTIGLAVEAMKVGAADFLTKPFEHDQLDTVIAKALERRQVTHEVERLLGEISHDMKNLLMPVVCGTDLLGIEIGDIFKRLPEMEAIKAEESHQLCDEVLDMLRSTTRRLQDRMKEIADYVKSLNAPPNFAPCRIAEVAANVVNTLRLVADGKGITIQVDGLDALPAISADEGRLYNAFYNLVNNAIPELPAGGSITIRGRSDPSAGVLVLSVVDTGRGMSPQVRDSLFTGRAISRKPGGTGLGTKIVKDVIEAHRGQITVESTEGVGTTFHISLPIHPP